MKAYLRLKPQDVREPHKGVRVMLLALSDVGVAIHTRGAFYVEMKVDRAPQAKRILDACGYCADVVAEVP